MRDKDGDRGWGEGDGNKEDGKGVLGHGLPLDREEIDMAHRQMAL